MNIANTFKQKAKTNFLKLFYGVSLLVLSKSFALGAYIGASDTITVSPAGNTSTPWVVNENLDIDGTLKVGTSPIDTGIVNLNATFISGINSPASITVTGIGSQINISDALYLGWAAAGNNTTMSILDGGYVQAKYGQIGVLTGSSGHLTISDAGSKLEISGSSNDFWIGSQGNGRLDIVNGGELQFSNAGQNIIVGREAGITGTVNIDGEESLLNVNNANILVAQNGTGIFNVDNNGAVFVQNFYTAQEVGANAQINLNNGAQFNATGGAAISIAGQTSFTLNNASVFSAAHDLIFAVNDGSSANVDIAGDGSVVSSATNIYIAKAGTASVTLHDNATLKAQDTIYMAAEGASSASLNIGAKAGDAAIAPGIVDTPNISLGNATINFNHNATDYIFNSQLTSAATSVAKGTINQFSGRTKLTADSSNFIGQTNITGGSLVVNGQLGGTTDITADGTLEGLGVVGSTVNNGTIKPGDNNIGLLTINGDYTSTSGKIIFDTVLGLDDSATDFLHITGNASGATSVYVINRDGLGALTTGNGIQLVQVDGTSQTSNFTLVGDYSFEGRVAVAAGAYAYSLYAGNLAGDFAGDWYLRSLYTTPEPEPKPEPKPQPEPKPEPQPKPVLTPVYSPTVPIYEIYPQILQRLNNLATLEQRVGNRQWLLSNSEENFAATTEGRGFWMRAEGLTGHVNSHVSKTKSNYDIDLLKMQLGLDFYSQSFSNGQLIGGVYFQYGNAKADISSRFSKGDIKTTGYGFGGTLTWYGNNEVYIDSIAQLMWFDSDLRSKWLPNQKLANGNHGNGYSLSIETGKKIAVNNELTITPQAQLSYNSVDFNSFSDKYHGYVQSHDGDALTARLGMSFDHTKVWKSSKGDIRRFKAYAIGNLYYDFLNGTEISVTRVYFRNRTDRFWGGLGTGLSYNWKDDSYSIYGEVDGRTSFSDFGNSYTFNATLGFRSKF